MRDRRLRTPALAALLVAGLGGAAVALRFAGAPAAPCGGRGTVVWVDGRSHHLFLCRDDRAEGRFRVALGRAGLDKRREGDGRTPKGTYPLGTPRVSTRFHRFIPVGYPTAEERAQGSTGGGIGIHGPHSALRYLGGATALADWTQGCVAVGRRDEIEAVAAWVESARPRSIVID